LVFKALFYNNEKSRFKFSLVTNPAFINGRHLSGAGRKKIRGGAVVLAEADRIFLIFWSFLINQKGQIE
jgi:hypothetical protein